MVPAACYPCCLLLLNHACCLVPATHAVSACYPCCLVLLNHACCLVQAYSILVQACALSRLPTLALSVRKQPPPPLPSPGTLRPARCAPCRCDEWMLAMDACCLLMLAMEACCLLLLRPV